MVNNPPPDVAAAAAKVQSWLNGQAPQKATDADFAKMSNADRLDYVRRFPQTLDNGQRK